MTRVGGVEPVRWTTSFIVAFFCTLISVLAIATTIGTSHRHSDGVGSQLSSTPGEPRCLDFFPSVTVPFHIIPPAKFDGYSLCDLSQTSQKHGHTTLALPLFSQHPWHTDATAAEVIFIPTLVDYITRNQCPGGKGHTTTDYVLNIVASIMAFGQYPTKRHVLIANDFTSHAFYKELQKRLPRLIVAKMEGPSDDCSFGLGYVTNYAVFAPTRFDHEGNGHPAIIPNRRSQVFKISITADYNEQSNNFGDRQRLFESPHTDLFPWPVYITTTMQTRQDKNVLRKIPRCPDVDSSFEKMSAETNPNATATFDRCGFAHRLSRHASQVIRELSEFELVLRGDTPGGDRWMNAMATPNAPILIAVGDSAADALDWLPFQKIIDWESFVVVLNRKNFRRR
jgi:hypothetical protein